MFTFLSDYDFTNLVKGNTCFNINFSYTDLIIMNSQYSFELSTTFETGLRDSMLKTMPKTIREKPKTLAHHDFKTFSAILICSLI